MKKNIIMVFVFCTGLLVAQDIEGTYRATGQRVQYEYYTRPNVHLDSQDGMGGTNLVINDAYGLGVSQVVSNIPAGYNFGNRVVGPIGVAEMDALQYFLYVTFNEDGTGIIADSQVLAGETEGCETEITLLPLDDPLTYSSDLNAGLTVQEIMVTGQPNVSPYAGQSAGSWSIAGSSFFSFFPPAPTPVTAEFQLYGAEFAVCYATCLAMPETAGDHAFCGGMPVAMGGCADLVHGYPGMPHPGTTAGYVIPNPTTSFAASNNYFGHIADYHVEWHYIDGPVAQTGLGDIVGEDEDGNGDDYDNILGYPNLTSTATNPACGFNYPILGDVTALLPEGCVDLSAGGTDGYAAGTFGANSFYLMDASLEPWGNFLTWNASMFTLTGDPSFLVDDSAADMNPADIAYLDLDADGVPETPFNPNGGKLVMTFEPTCIPVVTAISVLGELTDVGGCANAGDVNADGQVNVLDVVEIVAFILGNATEPDCADYNADGGVDVLDVVAMVSTILGNRGEEASSATFTKTSELMTMSADGVVGAVEMTLSHGSDFNLKLTDNALIADYNTDGGTTKLIVVNPEGDIFSSTGDYTVEEVVAATTEGYINTNWEGPVSISLGKAYPNPFNPSTSFDLNVGIAGNVSVMVYSVNGQLVDVIHEGNMNQGTHNMTWSGENVASGMYIIKANSADVTTSQKVMLIK